jgi:transcriptional regulator with XRE-family HTH domain
MGKPVRNRRRVTKLGEKLGKRFRSIRQRKGWSLEILAERAGMHVTYLSSVERGYRNPTLNVIGALADALGISLSELFAGVDKGGER